MIVFSIILFYLCSLSSKDPVKSHVIGNITNYFNIYPNITNEVQFMCVCNNVTYVSACTKENILEGCLNLSSNIIGFNPFLTRKLTSDSFCTDMQESFARNKGKRLDYIFNLKYNTIRKISITMIIVDLTFSVILLVTLIIHCRISFMRIKPDIKNETKKKINICHGINQIIFDICLVIAYIGQYVLFLLLLHFIESGDIGKFDDFLDCKNVKTEFFKILMILISLENVFLLL